MLTLFRLATDEANLASHSGGLPVPESTASVCRLATGRSALLHLINRLPHPRAVTVLLPSYVAEGVIQPFLYSGFTVMFYRLQSDLTPMAEDVETLLEQVGGNAVFVLIHYFGFSARSAKLASVLIRYSPVVVEDCAHALFTTTPSGESFAKSAEICLYSLNKFLPVVDGAILISNRPDINVSMDENDLPELPESVQRAYRDHLQSGRDLFESEGAAQAKVFLHSLEGSYESYYSVINSDLSLHRQSSHSRRMEEIFPFDQLSEQRLINSRILYEGLRSSTFSLVFPTLPPGAVPFCIPARVPARRRGAILDELFTRGIMLSTLVDKWDFVPADQYSRYAVEKAFLDEHVLIPVSEFITTVSMRHMVKQLNDI